MKTGFALLVLAFSTPAPAPEPGFLVAGHAWTCGKDSVSDAIDANKAIVHPLRFAHLLFDSAAP